MTKKRNNAIVTRMRRAGVPRSCWSTVCEDQGLGYINEWAKDIGARFENHEAKTSVYVHVRNKDAVGSGISHVELYARQAVANGVPGKLLTLPRLIHLLRAGEPQRDPDDETTEYTIFDVFGAGFIAIPVLHHFDEAKFSRREYEEAMGFLASHLYEGGLLIAAGTKGLDRNLKAGFPVEFEKVLFESSNIVGV